ncbi:MAG: phosphatase PAP2 family protein [Candidatus Hodarchaeota archaeon]
MELNIEESLIKLLISIIIVWIILAIIFGFSDLEISKAVVNRESSWAEIGKYYGEAPGYGIIAIAIAIIIGSYQQELKKQKIAAFIILMIGVIILVLALIFSNIWFIAFGGGITFAILLFLIFTYNRDWRNFKKIAIVIIMLAIINPLIFVQITKILCGRVRYNDLSSDYSNYTPWFLPPGPRSGLEGNVSFPSGHTSMGWMFLPLLILFKERKWKNPKRIIITILVISWGLYLGISRIVTGDHYASDVLFSTGVAFVSTILLYKKVYLDRD